MRVKTTKQNEEHKWYAVSRQSMYIKYCCEVRTRDREGREIEKKRENPIFA